jgi:hypothetical protein
LCRKSHRAASWCRTVRRGDRHADPAGFLMIAVMCRGVEPRIR